jgi:hypothetical protein
VQDRFTVCYVVDWGDTPRERSYPSLLLAEEFANVITTDGTTAYPNVATIIRRTREHDLLTWENDESFDSIKISRGKRADELRKTK